jgi:regulator of protease activity HflC (stomatin/prohibitin superfamily)
MTGYAIPLTAACVVVLALVGMLLWLLHLARQAQAEKESAIAARSAQQQAAQQRAMAQASADAAPTDAALDTALKDGTF